MIVTYPLDIDECSVNNGNCSDICVNDIPYHHCECEDGDELDPTGFTCIHNVQCSGKGVNCSCLPGYRDLSGEAFNCTGKLQAASFSNTNIHFSYISEGSHFHTIRNVAMSTELGSITKSCIHILVLLHADVDECELEVFNCTDNSHCINAIGNYMCICNHGYHNNGTDCCKANQ